ncbi:class I tRNA ligase family protein [Staphylococcus aureus]
MNKNKLHVSVLSYTLTIFMRMLHPFMRFVTEKIWQSLHMKVTQLLKLHREKCVNH